MEEGEKTPHNRAKVESNSPKKYKKKTDKFMMNRINIALSDSNKSQNIE